MYDDEEGGNASQKTTNTEASEEEAEKDLTDVSSLKEKSRINFIISEEEKINVKDSESKEMEIDPE